MGVLAAAARCLVRGADRISKWTSKRGPRSFKGCKGRGTKGIGFLTSGWRFVQIKEMVPEFVVPDPTGFKLKPYVSYRVPESEETSLTAAQLFSEAVAPAIEKDFKDGTFDPDNLEKCGFEPTQEGKLFRLYPRNFLRWWGGGGAACPHLISIKRLCQLKAVLSEAESGVQLSGSKCTVDASEGNLRGLSGQRTPSPPRRHSPGRGPSPACSDFSTLACPDSARPARAPVAGPGQVQALGPRLATFVGAMRQARIYLLGTLRKQLSDSESERRALEEQM
ncbi:uncharacterized protein LOC116813786 [Hylobates moloch]|uniref:uncharacterized protein LOC116813786 n=1 Tax=Hylobates moloch TaxID=81572 RepID=UPI002674D9C9|nr:uncharacterized protein LOC116813786 [Hylobates moloch]